jgi:serine/threonine protein kinase
MQGRVGVGVGLIYMALSLFMLLVMLLCYYLMAYIDVLLLLLLLLLLLFLLLLSLIYLFIYAPCRFYAARTLMGISALHERGIVYRDLKPDNILLDDLGYSRVSDLGLACRVPSGGLTGACGTRGYWAPEMIRRDDEGHRIRYFLAVDWFSFGCMLYEFIYGTSPFRTDAAKKYADGGKTDRDSAIDKATLEMDPDFDKECFDAESTDICTKLLCKDPAARLGSKGPQEIMDHPFFSKYIDWKDFKFGLTPPPMVPPKDLNMASQAEIGMFSDDKVSRKVELNDTDQEAFGSWDFVNKLAFQEEVVGFMRYEEINVSFFYCVFI